MTQTAEYVQAQFEWPKQFARRSLDKQKNAFDHKQPSTRVLLTPRLDRDYLWLGDASLIHDLGWWWLTTLRVVRTAVSLGFETIGDLFADFEVFNDIAEEAYSPVEAKLVNPYQVRLYMERLYFGMNHGEKAFAASRTLAEVIRRLEGDLANEAYADLSNLLSEAEDFIRHGKYAGTAHDLVVQKLATNTSELLKLLEKERRRAAALRKFSSDSNAVPPADSNPTKPN